jgi:hypothetical protein
MGHHVPGKVRITANRVALIDWDESHVDIPDLDLVLPNNAAGRDDGAHEIAAQASAAWKLPSAGTVRMIPGGRPSAI